MAQSNVTQQALEELHRWPESRVTQQAVEHLHRWPESRLTQQVIEYLYTDGSIAPMSRVSQLAVEIFWIEKVVAQAELLDDTPPAAASVDCPKIQGAAAGFKRVVGSVARFTKIQGAAPAFVR